ncbi:uncharacterized protein LOC125873681 [Solanum stenotomum]|uniref:uncharacterized protein LOC125873681 n=1 Tax=Solanum stenotomum TaxID=172797 RepID=UPI0020D1E5A7|nr:uncharacterized protein LOC125873681 [Solanum stenotomum]
MARVKLIQQHLVTAQSRQKGYADRCVSYVPFSIGERVLLKASPTKGVMRFGKKGKLSLRFIRPFEILKKYKEVAYRLALPPSPSVFHRVFHVFMLKQYPHDDSHVIQWDYVSLDQKLAFEEEFIVILDRKTRKLRCKHID